MHFGPEHESIAQELTSPGGLQVRNLIYTCPVDHLGTSVFVKGWAVPANENPPIILIHDLGENASFMASLAKHLTNQNHSVYSFDQRGHGQSGRRLGYIPSFQQLAVDLLQVVAWVKHKEGGKKPILVGQGLGALVVLFFAKGHSKFCQGVALFSPMLLLQHKIKPFRRFVIKWLAEFFPVMTLPHWLCPHFTVDDQNEKTKGKNQPKMSALLTHELLQAVAQGPKMIQFLRLPSLIVCPNPDPIFRYESLKRIVSKYKNSENVELKFVDSLNHRLLTVDQPTIELMAGEIVSWLKRQQISKDQTPCITDQKVEFEATC